MRTFNRGVENLKYLMAKHEAEWRIENGEEGVKIPTLENFTSAPIKRPRKSESNLPENRFLSNAEPKVESVQVLENSGKHHSWLYNEVMKAINDAAAKNKNSRIIAIFVPVLQETGEFKDLPVDDVITINKPDNAQDSGITEGESDNIVDITSVLPEPEPEPAESLEELAPVEEIQEAAEESPEPEESSEPEAEKIDEIVPDEPSEDLNAIESPVDEGQDLEVVQLEEIQEPSEEEESPEPESPEELAPVEEIQEPADEKVPELNTEALEALKPVEEIQEVEEESPEPEEISPAVEESEPESEPEPELILIEEPVELKELETPDEIVEEIAESESEPPAKLIVIEEEPEEPAESDSDLAELENLDDSITEEPVLVLPDDDEEIKIEESPTEIVLEDSDSDSASDLDSGEIEILQEIPPIDDDEEKHE